MQSGSWVGVHTAFEEPAAEPLALWLTANPVQCAPLAAARRRGHSSQDADGLAHTLRGARRLWCS